jgi:hypothetical protein
MLQSWAFPKGLQSDRQITPRHDIERIFSFPLASGGFCKEGNSSAAEAGWQYTVICVIRTADSKTFTLDSS